MKAWIVISALAFCVLVGMAVGVSVGRRSTATIATDAASHTKPPAPKPTPPAAPDLRLSLITESGMIQNETQYQLVTTQIFMRNIHIVNHSADALLIYGLKVNGEFNAPALGDPKYFDGPPAAIPLPVALSIGDSVKFGTSSWSIYSAAHPGGYAKEIIFIDVTTGAGVFRYKIQ